MNILLLSKRDHDMVNENGCRDLDDKDDSERMFGQVRLKICIFASSKTDCVHLLAPASRIPFKQLLKVFRFISS